MISYKDLKEQLTEEQICNILHRLGCTEFQDKGDYYAFKTICHNLDETDAKFNLIYYKESKLFHCFSECGQTFDIYGLVGRRMMLEEQQEYHREDIFYFVLNHSNMDVNNIITDNYEHTSIADYEIHDTEVTLPEYNDKVLELFIPQYCPEWTKDGIDIEAHKKFNISYSISRNKIIIPHYDINDRLIGIRGRALNKEEVEKYGKYAPIYVEQKIYNHPLGFNLYGLNKTKEEIKRQGIAIIGEGEKSVLQAETFLGEHNITCAACGSSINRWQVLLLVKYCNVREIIVAFDREEKDGENKYFYKLWNMCNKYKEYCDFSFIYDNKLLKMKESPFDCGEAIFKELIRRRVIVK